MSNYERWSSISEVEMALLDHAVNHFLDSIVTLLYHRVEFPSVSFDRLDDSSVDIHVVLTLKPNQKENFNEPRKDHQTDRGILGNRQATPRQLEDFFENESSTRETGEALAGCKEEN